MEEERRHAFSIILYLMYLNFISSEEEDFILSHFSPPRKKKGGRRSSIQRYGTKVYPDNYVSNEIPEHLIFLAEKLEPIIGHLPLSVTINTYLPQESILPHVDLGEGPVSIISLLSPAEMVLTKDKERIQFTLPPRSLYVLKDEHRVDWKHEILPLQSLRYSIVFRD